MNNPPIALPSPARVGATVRAPASKSFTHRALIVGALARRPLLVRGPLDSDDTRATFAGLAALGYETRESDLGWEVGAREAVPQLPRLDVGASGTSLRFLAALAAFLPGGATLTGTRRLAERPFGALLDALETLGARVERIYPPASLPLMVHGGALRGGTVEIDAAESSQFLSALLLIAPRLPGGLEIRLRGALASRPYVDLTVGVMQSQEVDIVIDAGGSYRVAAGMYRGGEIAVEGDYSSASYFFAAAAVSGGTVSVEGLEPGSVQGDRAFLDVLEAMGCQVSRAGDAVTVRGGVLRPIVRDCGDIPDMIPGLAVVAAFANGTSELTGIGALRGKESNRLDDLARELGRAGVGIETSADGLTVHGGELRRSAAGLRLDPHSDHRLAMAFAVLALRQPGVELEDPHCVAKSFPGFWRLWERLAA